MYPKYDLIIFTLSRWDAPISSPSLSLAKEFSKNNRVFYIDHPYSWKDFAKLYNKPEIKVRKKALLFRKNIYTKSKESNNLTFVTPGISLPINFLPVGKLYNLLSKYNDRIIFSTIRRIIKEFDIKDFVFINAFDPFFAIEFPSDIKPLKKIYQSMDDLSQVAYTAKHGIKLEEAIIKAYDITLTTSRELRRLKSQFSDKVFLHPNAADVSLFRKSADEILPKPKEFETINKKVIGFTGNLEERTDYELLRKIAEKHSDKILLLVGPFGNDEYKTVNLDKIPNVIFAGPKNIKELPAYLQYMDCLIIPFKCSILTKSIYPLKINEYLAAGKPVIATHFSEDIYSFKDVAYIAENQDEFINYIDIAIAENNEEKKQERIKATLQNTWTARVDAFWEILSEN